MNIIALDIGNVCLRVNPESFFQELGITMEAKYLPLLQAYDSYEKGFLSEENIFKQLDDFFEKRFTRKEFNQALNSVIGEEIPGMGNVVRTFQEKGFKVVFFSDTCPTHLKYIRENLSFSENIPDQIVSFAVGAKKPDAKMYEAMELQFCGESKPVLYFDDLEPNIEAAKKRGWGAHIYQSPEHCLDVFEDLKNRYDFG